jgi:hypothetical protein
MASAWIAHDAAESSPETTFATGGPLGLDEWRRL